MTEGTPRRLPAREPAARTYPRALPIVPVRARGLTIEDAHGRRYLDCLSGAGTLALGHNHPVVLEAIRTVLDSGAPLDVPEVPDLATPVEDAFVAELSRTLPPGLAEHARVRFCGPSATQAVATAVALVRAATGRSGIVTLTGTGHGTPSAMSGIAGEVAPSADASPASPPSPRCAPGASGTGDGDGTERAVHWPDVAALLPARADAGPAGILVEPVHGDCGVIPAPDSWMRAARHLTTARSVPLIVDETRTGVGRTGAFWAAGHSGVAPDVMILSEAIGGGLPLAAVIHHEDLALGRPVVPAGPFRCNQLALAAGTATLAHVREHRLAERAATIGSHMLSQLRSLARESPCIGEVRGRGLMIGVELVEHREAPHFRAVRDEAGVPQHGAAGLPPRLAARAHSAHPAAPSLAAAVQRECLRRGLIVGIAPRRPSVVRLLPPLIISDEQASAVLDRLADALAAAARAHPGETGRPSRRWDRPLRDHADNGLDGDRRSPTADGDCGDGGDDGDNGDGGEGDCGEQGDQGGNGADGARFDSTGRAAGTAPALPAVPSVPVDTVHAERTARTAGAARSR